MRSTDKFLIGIVAGVLVLVGVAFAVAFLRPEPTFRPDDSAEGVAHNYLLALQQADYERAYGYLSPSLKGYPDSAEAFARDARNYQWNFGAGSESITLEVKSARVIGEQTVVEVQETRFYEGGLFDSSQYTNTFDMTLRLDGESGAWKITASGSYWAECWDELNGCLYSRQLVRDYP